MNSTPVMRYGSRCRRSSAPESVSTAHSRWGWLGVMMIAGILGALGAVTISVPTAAKLARLEVDPRGGLPEAFQVLRKRQIFAATIAGGFGLIAMFAVTLGKW